MADETPKTDASSPAAGRTLRLHVPIQFGENAPPIEELTFALNARAFRDFALPMREDGTIMFQPYELAKVGLRMAGQPAPVLDRLDPADMMEVAERVMGFLVPGQKIGGRG